MTAGHYLIIAGVDYPLISYETDKQTTRAVNTCKVSIPMNYDSAITTGSDSSVGYYDAGVFVVKFGGYLLKKKVENQLNITIESYGGVLNRTNAEEVYYNQTPEYIVEDLVTDYTDLTYASSNVSGVTLKKFVVNNMTIAKALKELGDALPWQIRTDNDKNLYYEPEGEVSSAESLTVNSNCYVNGQWDKVPDRIINKIVFVGDAQRFSNSGSSVSTGATAFNLTYEPVGNMLVEVQRTGAVFDEQTGGVTGATGDLKYTWDPEQKLITFEDAPKSGSAVKWSYEYEVPIKITSSNQPSVDAYGEHSKKITNKQVKTMSDARDYVQTIFNNYAEPGIQANIMAKNNLNINVGETILVIDTINGVDEDLVIQRVKDKYPNGMYEMLVGSPEFEQFDWQTSTEERIRKLEDEQDSSNIVQKYVSMIEGKIVTFEEVTHISSLGINDSWIWDVSEWATSGANGAAGSSKWGDRRDGSGFNSFEGDFVFGSVWSPTGIATYSGSAKMLIENGTANYKGWDVETNDYSLIFGGTDEYVDTNCDVDLSGSGAFSLFAWVKDIPVGSAYMIAQTHTVGSYTSDWILGYQNGGLWMRGDTIGGGNIISDGDWHLTGFTFDGTTATLYIDGVAYGTPVTPTGFGAVGSVKLMTRGDATSTFVTGQLDEVTIWDKCLTPTEITELYNNGKVFNYKDHSAASNLIAYYKMGDGDDFTGSDPFTVHDEMGNYDGVTANMESADKTTDHAPTGSNNYYSTQDGKIRMKFDKASSATAFACDFRNSGTGFYRMEFDFLNDQVVLKSNLAGATAHIGSASHTYATNNLFQLRFSDNKTYLYDNSNMILVTDDSSVNHSGSVRLVCAGSAWVNDIKIFGG